MTPKERAQVARREIEGAILDLLSDHPNGLRNVDVAEGLGLRSSTSDNHKNYLTWAILGGLVRQQRIKKLAGQNPRYVIA